MVVKGLDARFRSRYVRAGSELLSKGETHSEHTKRHGASAPRRKCGVRILGDSFGQNLFNQKGSPESRRLFGDNKLILLEHLI